MTNPTTTTPLTSFLCGGAAGTAVDCTLYPLDTLKTRMQSAQGFRKAGGFRSLYSGIVPVIASSAPSAALFFGCYEWMKMSLVQSGPAIFASHPAAAHIISSAVGEFAACLLRVPSDNVKQRLQVAAGLQSLAPVCATMSAQGGIRIFYGGFGATMFREVPFAAIQFPLYEWFKKAFGDGSRMALPLCGALAGGIAAIATTPLDVIRTRLMLQTSATGERYTGARDVIRRIYADERGIRTLFSGVGPRVTYISLGGAVFFGVYEAAVALTGRQGRHP